LGEAQENISKAMSDLRDIAKGLSSERIQLLNLKETITQELQRFNKTGLIKATVQVEGVEQSIDVQGKLIIFRIVQERLQNIIKHAAATLVIVSIQYRPDVLIVLVSDNGKGFDINIKPDNEKGLGLQNMINRTAVLGGSVAVESAPGAGTRIYLTIPYV